MAFSSGDYDCIICLEICVAAVESTCCGNLFCEVCVRGMRRCPICRDFPFKTTTNKYIRKMIGRMKLACPKCKLLVQRDSILDHDQLCEMRKVQCAARNCDFAGPHKDLLQHALDFHERDILSIIQGLKHIFQPASIDCSIQTVPTQDTKDASTQTTIPSLQLTASIHAANCSDYNPKKSKRNILYYCGRQLPYPCSCKTIYGDCFGYGCQQSGRCGPEGGHNCPDCQKLDLQERGLPQQGYVVDELCGEIINFHAPPGQCVVKRYGCNAYNPFDCRGGNCEECRLYRSMSTDKNSLYYQFRCIT